MWLDLPVEDLSAALDDCVEELLWEAGVVTPAVDAFHVALQLGMTIATHPTPGQRAERVELAYGSSATSTSVILVADDERNERRQFSVAHEIGEFAAHRVFERLAVDPRHLPAGTREQVANSLAGRLLVPHRWLRARGLEFDWDLMLLKQSFETASCELIARRMLDMRPKIVLTLFDLGHPVWRKKNFSGECGPLLEAEWNAWTRCHATGMEQCEPNVATEAGDADVRCWAIHEPDWKREIMRTEISEW